MKKKLVILAVCWALFAVSPLAQAQKILLWENYGQALMISPETGMQITPDFDLRLALAANARQFEPQDTLPQDLSSYDIIFITLGFAMDCG
ncbi:MAG: hypothetical protein GXO74_05615 [Calditrichaeota bacterium]|nr:hypothetical protein [Calditrichota bacterium]